MPLRYYISNVLPPDPPPTDPDVAWKNSYRLAISDANVNAPFSYHFEIPPLPDQTPAFAWGLAICRTTVWTAIDADARNFRLFQGDEGDQETLEDLLARLDSRTMGALTTARRNNIRNKATGLGLSTADMGNTVSLRVILQKFARFLRPNFDETKFYIP